MPQKKGKRHSRSANNNGAEWSTKPRSYEQDEGGFNIICRENKAFEIYYQAQNLVPEDVWPEFVACLRRDLPHSFRITGSRQEALRLKEILTERYLQKMQGLCIEGVPVEVPLVLKCTLPRKVIRKSPVLGSFHNFLVTETELGNISRQEAVSMIPPLLMDIQPESRVLDMCAAPGSKTAQLIEMLHRGDDTSVPSGFVIANDADNKRCYLLVHQALKRLQSPSCVVTNHDASSMPNLFITETDENGKNAVKHVQYDRILCDVPCSGDGTLRKNVDIWQHWSVNKAHSLHGLQLRIARRGAELLKEGGMMVYSTCSLNPVENEAVVATLLKLGEGSLELVDVSDKLPDLKRAPGLNTWTIMDSEGNRYESYDQLPPSQRTVIGPNFFPPSSADANKLGLDRCIRILPHLQDTGGFFVAVLRKFGPLPWSSKAKDSSNGNADRRPPRKKRKNFGFKEDPFVFLLPNDPAWKLVQDHFGIPDSFPDSQLLGRCNENDEGQKRRNLYFVSPEVKSLIELNYDCAKLINAGLRTFGRADQRHREEMPFRLVQEGLPMLLPYLQKRKVAISVSDMTKILASGSNCLTTSLSEDAQMALQPISEGSLAVHCTHKGHTMAICCWKGMTTMSLHVAKETRVHLLRLLDFDTEALEMSMQSARKQKAASTAATDNPENVDADDADIERPAVSEGE